MTSTRKIGQFYMLPEYVFWNPRYLKRINNIFTSILKMVTFSKAICPGTCHFEGKKPINWPIFMWPYLTKLVWNFPILLHVLSLCSHLCTWKFLQESWGSFLRYHLLKVWRKMLYLVFFPIYGIFETSYLKKYPYHLCNILHSFSLPYQLRICYVFHK